MRIVVTGGRDFKDRDFAWSRLDTIHGTKQITSLVHGDATGLDRIAKQWAIARGVVPIDCRADWDNVNAPGAVVRTNKWGKKYNVKAGPDRNQRMIDDYKPDAAVVFAGGNGTADMTARIIKAKIPILP